MKFHSCEVHHSVCRKKKNFLRKSSINRMPSRNAFLKYTECKLLVNYLFKEQGNIYEVQLVIWRGADLSWRGAHPRKTAKIHPWY